jgi:hypothetical protein
MAAGGLTGVDNLLVAAGVALAGAGGSNPILRAAKIPGNWVAPNEFPTPESILNAYTRGFLGEKSSSALLRVQGVSWGSAGLHNEFSYYWEGIRRSQEHQLGLAGILRLWQRGDMLPDEVADRLSRSGIHDPLTQELVKMLAVQPLPAPLLMDAVNRGLYGWQDVVPWLKEQGYVRPTDLAVLDQLRQWKPGVGDVMQWIARRIPNLDHVAKGQLSDGFAELVNPYFRQLLRNNGVDDALALAAWQAHWGWVTEGEAFQLSKILRPERLHRYQALIPGIAPFGQADLATALRLGGKAPGVHPWLAALQVTPIGIRQVDRVFEAGVWTKDELVARFRDLGFLPEDAQALADTEEIRRRRTLAATGQGFTPAEVKKLYLCGGLSEREAKDEMSYLGFRPDESSQLILRADLEFWCQIRAKRIEVVHKSLLHGELSELQAQGRLAELGVPPNRAEQFLALWREELAAEQKQFGFLKLVDWFKRGLLSLVELEQRLDNLHVPLFDARRIILAALQDLYAAQTKENLKTLRAWQLDQEHKLRALEHDKKRREQRAKADAQAALKRFIAQARAQLGMELAQDQAEQLLELAAEANQQRLKRAVSQATAAEFAGQLRAEFGAAIADAKAAAILVLAGLPKGSKADAASVRAELVTFEQALRDTLGIELAAGQGQRYLELAQEANGEEQARLKGQHKITAASKRGAAGLAIADAQAAVAEMVPPDRS